MNDPVIEKLIVVLAAWVKFRLGHDLDSEKLRCCDDTAALFRALASLEEEIDGDQLRPRPS